MIELAAQRGLSSLKYHPGRDKTNSRLHAENIFKAIEQYCPKANDILDIGSGYGNLVKMLRSAGKNAIGIDLRYLGDPNTVIADARHMPFADESFDLVTECMMLEDMSGLQGFVDAELLPVALETKRVLRPNGLVITYGQFANIYRQLFHSVIDKDYPISIFRK